jgi:hypothetical protein
VIPSFRVHFNYWPKRQVYYNTSTKSLSGFTGYIATIRNTTMKKNSDISRRTMLAASAAATLGMPAILAGADPTKDPVRIGHIGAGTRGWDLLKYLGSIKNAKVVAVCDVYKPHLERGIEAGGNPGRQTLRGLQRTARRSGGRGRGDCHAGPLA